MALGFGLLSAQLRPGETDWSRAYRETIDLTREAERLGFASVWTTEHHFIDDGYMPSLLVVAAAQAAVTERVELGTGVILAPLHHPLRLAEDAATVALLSGGRLTLGLGLGWNPVEFAALGADLGRRGRAMEEILDILPRAWSGKPFSHQGDVYHFPEVGVRPAPSAPIPVLIGGGAEAAIRRAARRADGIFSNAPLDEFRRQVAWLEDECDRIDRDPATLRLIHYSVILPAADEEEAARRYGEHLWHMRWKYSDMEASATREGPPPPAPDLPPDKRGSLPTRSVLAGRAETIAETLGHLRGQIPYPVEFVARSYFATLDYRDQVELMERIAAEVAPHV